MSLNGFSGAGYHSPHYIGEVWFKNRLCKLHIWIKEEEYIVELTDKDNNLVKYILLTWKGSEINGLLAHILYNNEFLSEKEKTIPPAKKTRWELILQEQ